jgi:UDP-N-acetylglucosamine 2-epimerase
LKKILSIVGARPQFIKAAVVSRELRKKYNEVMVHTGQHYDYNMSDIFFEELDIPRPKYNLGISGGSHGKMTGEMLIAIEEVLLKETPNLVLLYGDTNSTLAGALAAVKLHIPVVHVESGNRFGTLESPEEVNRILTDHCSNLLLCCTESAKNFLELEGLGKQSFVVGDPMYDAFLFYSDRIGDEQPEQLVGLDGTNIDRIPNEFYYLTCHRQENTDKIENLEGILSAMEALDYKCIYPVHPRNQGKILELSEKNRYTNIIFCKPVGYMMSIFMVKHCKKIITDSGGLQREAFFAKKPCVTVLDFVVWQETMIGNCNQLCKPDKMDILSKLDRKVTFPKEQPFGNGNSAELIVNKIDELIE